MRQCIFELTSNYEAKYLEEYDSNKEYSTKVVLVIFNCIEFRDIIHLDDGDLRCILEQSREGKTPPFIVTR